MSAGRDRLQIGTYGDVHTTRTSAGTVRALTRYRDWDGEVRKVTATAGNARAAKRALREKLVRRAESSGFGAELSSESTVAELAEAWLEGVRTRSDLADGTKDVYRRELNSLVLPTFKKLRLYEVTVGRVDQFLKRQALVSDAYARHSRSALKRLFDFALRRDAIRSNPVSGTARLAAANDKKPKALSLEELDQVRHAVSVWRTGAGVMGPKPDGQVRDVIEVLLGTSEPPQVRCRSYTGCGSRLRAA
ncbi:phage integrase central domain-containing protein [Aeromicrobium piscarium]|uniref:Core-binding (CB) domain-containing protein n=1 Tax=Aeromicrobium piscarium TaxID=2590901 RepID=A0A554SCZ8_9ACTN|nr:hypothetical protein [Aeromicrobium piscarium]TSD64206.1 hypothetical protein FNM00_06540 [Aeromicrobium piscarium]